MTTNVDYYEVLGVGRDADDREIKRAFFRLLKEYPPEQKPTEYQRIREAYDTLSDPASRKEYDGLSEFGEEIAALRDEAESLLNRDPPDLDGAIRTLKKAVVLGPEIGYLRNQLGQCLLGAEQPRDALKQFRRAADINPDSGAFLLNVGRAQRAVGDERAAEATFREVWSRDEEDYAAPRALASLLFDRDRKREAHEVLDKAIGADGKVDFQDFLCLWDKLHFYLFGGDHDELPGILDTIRHVAKAEADRKYAAFMLADAASFLLDVKAYDKADMFLQAARHLAPHEEGVRDFADNVGEIATLDVALKEVLGDDSYHFLVQELVRVRLGTYLEYIDEPTGRKQFGETLDLADVVMETDPAATEAKASVRRVRREHPAAAELLEDLFDSMLSMPAARRYMAGCPYCGENVVVGKRDTGKVGCPHCYRDFRFDGESYRKKREPRNRPIRSPSSGSSSTSRSTLRATSSPSPVSTSSSGEGGVSVGAIIAVLVVLFFVFGICGVSGWFADGIGRDYSSDRSTTYVPQSDYPSYSEPEAAQDVDYERHGYSSQRGVNWNLVAGTRRDVRVTVPDGDLLSFRDAPSARHGDRLFQIPEGTPLVLTGCLPSRPEDGARWCQTSYEGTEGWVYDLYVQSEQEYLAVTRAREAEAYALGYSPGRGVNRSLLRSTSRSVRVAVPGGRSLPLRDVPSGEHGTALTDVRSGDMIQLTSCLPPRPEDGGSWCQARYRGWSGWVYDRYLDDARESGPTSIQTERISFDYMATSASVTGAVAGGRPVRYLAYVLAGQTVTARVTSGSGAYIEVYAPGRPIEPSYRAPSETGEFGGSQWRGVVSRSGDYQFVVRSVGGHDSFSLHVAAD